MPPGIAGRQTAPYEIPECKTMYPTMEEFKDFNKYMEYLESIGAHHAGVVKVVAPKEWVPRRQGYDLDGINYDINGPIKQHFKQVGGRGCYQTKGIVQQKTTVKEYEKMANSSQFRTPNHSSYDDLERKYWKTLSFCPPIYGCDVADSITDEDQESWNIRNLGSILNMVNEDYDQTIKGVNSPYLYFGMWKATFSWHVEDMDLHSINYLHYGQPKTWYVVPPKYGYLMERAARKLFPNVASWCSNFMRHKTCLISPHMLDQLGVPYQKVVQEERNAIIVFPYAYHSGFNHGFNIAESTNFALERWIEYGKRARQCDCSRSRVTFSMDTFVKRFQPEKYEDWKSGKDIAPHPEDPEEVRQEIMLRANNPAEYAKMMQERMWLGDKSKKKGAKPRNTCPLPEDSNQDVETGNSKDAASSKESNGGGGGGENENSKTFQVYQHHELQMVRVLVNPETMKCYRGLQNLKDKMDLDEDPDIEELIAKSILIHVDDEVVNLAVKRAREPPEIHVDVDVYSHKYKPEIEANVHPITLALVGEQSAELKAYLGTEKNIKTEITTGNFDFNYSGSVRVPNPNYVPSDGSDANGNQDAKRMKTDLSKLERLNMAAQERMLITANIFHHIALNESITLTSRGNYLGKQPSKELVESLEGRTLDELVTSGTLLKVGERKVHMTTKITDLRHGVFAFGDDEVKVEVAAGRTSMVYKVRTGNEDTLKSLKDNSFSDLVNARLLARRTEQSAVKSLPSEIMLTSLSNPCYVHKCEQHREVKKVVSSEADQDCGCKIKGQSALAKSLNASREEVIVLVDEISSTVTLIHGRDLLLIKREEQAPHDMLDSAQETAKEADLEEEDDDDDDDSDMDDEDSDDDNQAFTSDEEQESDAESSDDPDFMEKGHTQFDYSWKHSSAGKKKQRKMRKAAMKERFNKMRGGSGKGHGRGGGKRRGIMKRAALGYEGFLTVANKILDRFENGDPEVAEEMIVASDLAQAIQHQYSDVSKSLEMFKVFEIMELIDSTELAYQWVSRDSVRLQHLLRRIYHEEPADDGPDGGGDIDELWSVVRGVVKCLLQSRRGTRFYVNKLAQDLFTSQQLEDVSHVMSFLELLGVVKRRRKSHAGGFEYIGPDIDAPIRDGLLDDTTEVSQEKCSVQVPQPKVRKSKSLKKTGHGKAKKAKKADQQLANDQRESWDAERVELERQRSIKYAKVTCKCGSFSGTKWQTFRGKKVKVKVASGHQRRKRCLRCDGCQRGARRKGKKARKCGTCTPCMQPSWKQPCVNAVCKYPVIPRCPCFP